MCIKEGCDSPGIIEAVMVVVLPNGRIMRKSGKVCEVCFMKDNVVRNDADGRRSLGNAESLAREDFTSARMRVSGLN